jgi:hypothetical protein
MDVIQMNEYEMMGLFSVPLLIIKFNNHYKYKFSEVEKKDQKPYNWEVPLHTTFPNIGDDDPIVSTEVRDNLRKDILETIVNVFGEINLPTNIFFSNMWYNIYHDNQGQEKHNHLSPVGVSVPFWSGIYYNKNASPTEFFRSGSIWKTQLFDGFHQTLLNDCLIQSFKPFVEDGDIVLFPPYLEHSVKSKLEHKNKMRMTFSFNIGLNK